MVALLAGGALPQVGCRALLAGKGAPIGGWVTLLVGRAAVQRALGHQLWLVQPSSASGGVGPPTAEGPQGLGGSRPGTGGRATWGGAPGAGC